MNQDKMIWKVGIIGCGRIAGLFDAPSSEGGVTTHAKAYYSHPNFQIVAAVDTNAENLTWFRQTWSVPKGYTALHAMLANEQLDVVSLCSPDWLHYEQSIELMSASNKPKLLIVEKPVCMEHGQHDDIRSLSAESGVSVIVNHTRRFDPSHRVVAEMVRSGAMGRLVNGRCDYYGGWLHNGTHIVDTLRMLLGDEPEILSSKVSGCGKPDDEDIDVTLSIDGAKVRIESFDESHYQLFQTELRFERGVVRLEDFGKRITVEKTQVNDIGERLLVPSEFSPLAGLDSPMYRMIEAVHESFVGSDPLNEMGVGLNEVGKTMNVMWRAKELAFRRNDAVEAHS